ncbi:hemerythrin domain-containing protein [Chloroflexota bacterium]
MENVGIPRDRGPIGVMLREHEMGRSYVKNMSEAVEKYKAGESSYSSQFVENAKKYTELLTQHIDKEDNILYPMADMQLSEEKQRELIEKLGCCWFVVVALTKKLSLSAVCQRSCQRLSTVVYVRHRRLRQCVELRHGKQELPEVIALLNTIDTLFEPFQDLVYPALFDLGLNGEAVVRHRCPHPGDQVIVPGTNNLTPLHPTVDGAEGRSLRPYNRFFGDILG